MWRRPARSDLSESLQACYILVMANETKTTKGQTRRTTTVPVTTMEEIPVLSAQERRQLTASLEQAEARIKAGKAIDYDPKTFKKRLIGVYRRGKR